MVIMFDDKLHTDPDTLDALRSAVIDKSGIKTAVNTDKLISLTEQVVATQQRMLDDAERDRQAAKCESRKNTAILILTAISVIVAATGVILTAIL